MRRLARLQSWFRHVVHRDDLERRMAIEMQAHLDARAADLQRAGLSEEDAQRRARAEFGSPTARQDECREAIGLRLLDEVRGDVTYALRLLRRSPAFTAVALLSLGLGIGANTAIFSLIDMALMKSLPVQDPARLVFIDTRGGASGGSSGPPYPLFERMRDHNHFFTGMAAFSEDRFKVTIDGPPEQVRGQSASGNYFEVLGVGAFRGRVFTNADNSVVGRGGPDGAVAVISHGFWNRRFAMDPGVVGRSIMIGSTPVTIVGITPPEFFGLQVGSPIDITIPIILSRTTQSKGTWWMSVVGRLQPDASAEQASAELDAMFGAYLPEVAMSRDRNFSGVALVPAARGLNALRRTFSEPLMIIMGIVAIVLAIGCANVANLLLARASARRNEMAVRLAIGASRSRVTRQLLTEGIVLVLLGALAGLGFAWWGVSFLVRLFGHDGTGIILNPQFDLRVLAFTAAVALLTGLLFSLFPALHATRTDAAKPAGGTASTARPRLRFGQSLVVLQVVLAVVLLCGAALFLRTLRNLSTLDAGYERQGVLTMVIEATVTGRTPSKTPAEHRTDHARLGAMWEQLAARLIASPGVASAAVSTLSPLTGRDRGVGIAIIGRPQPPKEERGIHVNQVTPAYFDTLGIRLVAGRTFTSRDRTGSLPVAILNETAARTYFAGANPVGEKVNFPGQRVEDLYEIVGVVRDTRNHDLRKPDERMVYLPLEQSIDPITMAALAVRGSGDVTQLMPHIRSAVDDAIPGGFITRAGTLDQRVERALMRERLLSVLAAVFGALALVLAAIGLYGVMAYSVVQRTREIGIRMAIGARQRSVVWMVVRTMLVLVVIGATLGSVSAVLVSRFVKSQLFGVAPGDPIAIAAAIALLLAVTAVAGYLPARRASRIDPMKALRCE